MRGLAVITGFVLVVPVTGCGLFESEPGPGDIAGEFLAAFAAGDTAGAAARTDAVETARALLDAVRGAVRPTGIRTEVREVTDGDRTARVRFAADWDLGRGRHWSYDGELEMRADADVWRVHWTPSVVHPELAAQQTVVLREDEAVPAPVLDRDGAPLVAPERVVSVVLDPAKAGDVPAVATRLAAAVNRFDPAITQQSILDGVARTPQGQSYTAVSLRDADYQAIKPQIYELPGVRFTTATRLLPVDRTFGSQVLPGVRKLVDEQLSGKAGWRVVTVNAAGGEVAELAGEQPKAGTAVTVSLSRRVQVAAEVAVDGLTNAAALVVVQPSTGDLLAVAQNPAADAQGPIALTGRFPPGSTFKIVTASAGLASGRVTAETPVGCPGTTTIGPRLIPNSNGFDKGTLPLRSAFAASCNTTFAELAAGLPADALTSTARQFGVGVDFDVPGITTVTGSVPPAQDQVERAEDGFGQGKVLVSPFGLALVTATVAAGTLPTPALLRGTETKVVGRAAGVDPAVLAAVRQMMREMVTSWAGEPLVSMPDVHGKTGTAQFGDGTHSHGWFTGFQGDMAFALLVTDAGASGVALEAAARFLTGLSQAPS